eukprot:1582155-Pyramimonas_sp.AAC.1
MCIRDSSERERKKKRNTGKHIRGIRKQRAVCRPGFRSCFGARASVTVCRSGFCGCPLSATCRGRRGAPSARRRA